MVNYEPLWNTLHDRHMNKGDLQKLTRLSSSAIAKLSKNEDVMMSVVVRICNALNCAVEEVVEITK